MQPNAPLIRSFNDPSLNFAETFYFISERMPTYIHMFYHRVISESLFSLYMIGCLPFVL